MRQVGEWAAASSPSAYDHRENEDNTMSPMRSPEPPRQNPDWLGAVLPPRPRTPPPRAPPLRSEYRPGLVEEGSYVVL